MNPGVVEEVGKVATGIVEAMKNQPLMIAVLVLNAMIFYFVFTSISARREQDHKIMTTLLDEHRETTKLLYSCLPGK
jgi:hypothetical protein